MHGDSEPASTEASANAMTLDPSASAAGFIASSTATSPSIVNVGPAAGIEENAAAEMNNGHVPGQTEGLQSEDDDTAIATGAGHRVGLSAERAPIGTTYALIDAEGSSIDLDSLDALREASDRLFADRHLSAGQILGLWESNEAARNEPDRAFGHDALEEADLRRHRAEEEIATSSPERGMQFFRVRGAAAPSYPATAGPSSGTSRVGRS